jgi:hypothetical protein
MKTWIVLDRNVDFNNMQYVMKDNSGVMVDWGCQESDLRLDYRQKGLLRWCKDF